MDKPSDSRTPSVRTRRNTKLSRRLRQFLGGTMDNLLERYDPWITEKGPAALVIREYLMPVDGPDGVLFPPTFAAGDGFPGGYNIDDFGDGKNVCLIDSVGSQANRIEPIFAEDEYAPLVPQVVIKAGSKSVNLLEAGHRAGDAVVRCSALQSELQQAFKAVQRGDCEPLAKIAPTSIVFGAWDSRDTQAKLPRLLASTIRAYDVSELKRSAQYNPPIDYIGLGLIEDADDKKVLDAASELGFRHAPAGGTHGGVLVHGEIRREAILSLVALRAVGPKGPSGDALRRYLLGLALVAMMHEREHNLRQGCLLVQDPEKKPLWELVTHDGARTPLSPDGKAALAFAEEAARAFGVGESRPVEFDTKAANEALKQQVGGKGARGKRGA